MWKRRDLVIKSLKAPALGLKFDFRMIVNFLQIKEHNAYMISRVLQVELFLLVIYK